MPTAKRGRKKIPASVELKLIDLHIPKPFLKRLDKWVEILGYPSRMAGIREALIVWDFICSIRASESSIEFVITNKDKTEIIVPVPSFYR